MYLKPRDMLITAGRVIGLLVMLKAIQGLITIIPLMAVNNDFTARWEVWQVLLQFISPLVLFILGGYLLKNADRLAELWKTNDVEEGQPGRDLFVLAMKITGLVLIVFALPEAFNILGNALYIKSVSGPISTVAQLQIIYYRLLYTLVSLVLGFYLLCGGRFFYRLAYPEPDESGENL